MKVLVVSHNVFSKTENMGKTLSSYFSAFKPETLAQFYIHSEIPITDTCFNYYRITDKEAIKSIFTRRCGTVFGKEDIKKDILTARTDIGKEAELYQKARKRTPFIYFLRNLWWGLSSWENKKFKKWIDDFGPDIVFLASGDYSFIYKIALKIAKKRNIPLVVSCMDDYYFNNKNADKFAGKLLHKWFMSVVYKTLNFAKGLFCISDSMCKEYEAFFGKKSFVLHTSASFEKAFEQERQNKISYLGNLGYNRHLQILNLGRTLKQLDNAPPYIDVYSSETRKEVLKDFTLQNGINFHGAVPAEEVQKIMSESRYLIHTESFDEENRRAVKYSVSTKIADSLMSGSCLIAYGPQEVASISYLKENNSAFVITEGDSLKEKLNELFGDSNISKQIIANANKLAQKNHNLFRNAEFLKEKLEEMGYEGSAS